MKNAILRSILFLSLTATAVGCRKADSTADDPAATAEGKSHGKPGPGKVTGKSSGQDTAAHADSAAGEDLFKDAASLASKLKAKVGGPVHILEFVLYPDHATVQVQDPKKPENVDQYDFLGGKFGDPSPVKLIGQSATASELKEASVDIGSVDFGLVPKIVKEAAAELKIEEGKVTHLVLKRNRPFSNDVLWRVYVSGPRKDGSVEYDPKGHMGKVYK